MKTRPIKTIIVTLLLGSLAILALIGIFRYLMKTTPVLTGYLSLHEMHLPSDSALQPEILSDRLSKESLTLWVCNRAKNDESCGPLLDTVNEYLHSYVISDLESDPLLRYSHYYRLIIENDGEKPFKDVFVRFPEVVSVELRRSKLGGDAEFLVPMDEKYIIGDINPGQTVTLFGWNDRPFYIDEENKVFLGHKDGLSEILIYKPQKPAYSWVKQNIILLVIIIFLIMLLLQKMVMIISTCKTPLDPELEERTRV